MRKIILHPINDNAYINILMECMKSAGCEVVTLSEGLRMNSKVEIAYLNWFEEIHSVKKMDRLVKYLIKVAIIKYLKIRKIKIVTVIHNKQSHEKRSDNYDIKLRTRLFKDASRIIMLSHETKRMLRETENADTFRMLEKKLYYIPHPNYCGYYRSLSRNYRQEIGIKEDEMVVLFIGGIRPYKNLELLIRVSNEIKYTKVKFVIAGKGNKNYIDSLRKTIMKDNVIFISKYIEDNEISDLIRCGDIFAVPLSTVSSLNSGSLMLSFSYSKNAICPQIGTIKDFDNEVQKSLYVYYYDNDSNHYEALLDAVNRACYDFFENKKSFIQKESKIYRYVQKNYSSEVVVDKIERLLNNMC